MMSHRMDWCELGSPTNTCVTAERCLVFDGKKVEYFRHCCYDNNGAIHDATGRNETFCFEVALSQLSQMLTVRIKGITFDTHTFCCKPEKV